MIIETLKTFPYGETNMSAILLLNFYVTLLEKGLMMNENINLIKEHHYLTLEEKPMMKIRISGNNNNGQNCFYPSNIKNNFKYNILSSRNDLNS